MLKKKYLIVSIIMMVALFVLGTRSFAAEGNEGVEYTKNVYANNGSAKFEFTGLELDLNHDYEFGITKTANSDVEKWYLISDYTETTATVDMSTTTTEFRKIILAVDKGYVTIKDKTADTVVLDHYTIDLTNSLWNLTNYNVINNGKKFGSSREGTVNINFWNVSNSTAYYQYEKITDEQVINKYREIKSNNGEIMELESLLKTTVPSSNWSEWGYFNGHGNNDDGYGYPTKEISAPDTGLYYLWIYLAGNNVKSTYGYILVDNLEPEIALDKITLPETRQVEIGKTITLTPTFNPEKTTNKIVTWSSSDESIATVSNTGVVTGKKIGGAIITVTSQDGSKKASCTVTVTDVLDSEVSNTDTNTGSQSAKENGNAGNSKATAEPVAETVKNATAQNGKKLNGTESKNLGPQAGASATIVAVVIGGMAFSVVMAKKAKKYRGIK